MRRLSRRLLAFGLSVIMILSMTACGSKAPKTMFEAMRLAREIKTYNLELEMSIETGEEKALLELIGEVDNEAQAAALDVYAEFSGIGLEIGTITLKDGILYLDITKLLDNLGVDEDTIAMMFSSNGIDAESFDSLTVYGLELGETKDTVIEANDTLYDHMIAALEQGAGETENAVSGKDGSWSMELDSSNVVPAATGILTYVNDNLDDIWDNLMTVLDASQNNQLMEDMKELAETTPDVEVDTAEIEDMIENPEDYKDDVAAALEEALDTIDEMEDAVADSDGQIYLDFSYSGKEGSRVCEMNLTISGTSDDAPAEIELKEKITEGEVSIEAPEAYTDVVELITLLSQMVDVDDVIGDDIDPVEDGGEDENVLTDHGELPAADGTVVEIWPGEGFAYDSANSSDTLVFLDYDNDYYTYAFMYLDDMGGDPEAYYEAAVQEIMDNPEGYPDAEVTELTSTEINGYTVWYYVLTYDYYGDGDIQYGLYSFSDLNTSGLTVCTGLETFGEDEWFATMDGDAEAILESLYNGMTIAQ